MKLAANLSLMFTEVPLLERFAAAKKAGFHAVEIQFPYEAELQDLQQAKQSAEVEVVLINVPAGDLMQGGDGLACVPDLQDEFKAALDQCEKYAKGLDVSCVNVLSGRCPQPALEAERLQTFKRNLCLTADRLIPLGVTTTFEAINTTDMPGFLIHSAQQMWDVIEELNIDSIKAQYDLYHMQMMGEDLRADFADHLDKIGHIQFADCPGRNEPGSGEMDWQALFEQIDQSPYEGYVAAEYRPSCDTQLTLDWMRLTK